MLPPAAIGEFLAKDRLARFVSNLMVEANGLAAECLLRADTFRSPSIMNETDAPDSGLRPNA